MGKWTEEAKKWPRREEEPGAFTERVRALKDEFRGLALEEGGRSGPLAAAYRLARDKKDTIEATLSGVNAEIKALEELIDESFKAMNRETPLYFPDGRRIEVSDQISVRTENPEAVIEWAKANGYERLLTMNAKRLEGLTKAALAAGQETPAGVSISSYAQVKLAG